MSNALQYLITGLGTGCTYALVASGLVVIYRVTRVVNFAQGAFAVIAAMAASTLLAAGLPHGAAELLAVGLGGAVGLAVGLVAIGKPGTSPQASLVATLGLGVFAYAVEVLVWGDQPRSYSGLPGAVDVLEARIQTHYLLIVAVTVVVFTALSLFFGRTYLGKGLSACASNPYAARIVGINVTRMGLLSFGVGGALGALAGVLITPVQQVTFDSDVALIVNGFAAAILGGLFRPNLALVGGLLLGVAQTLVAGYIDAAYKTELALILMLAVMIWRATRNPTVEEVTSH